MQSGSGSIKKIEGFKIYLKKQLGHGAYGTVYRAVNQKTSQQVAVKILKKAQIDGDPYLKSALLSEIKIMQTVKSENIVQLYDVLQSGNNYYIVQQLCEGGTLESRMRQNKLKSGKFNEIEAKQIIKQLANGFLSLVREGIIHRDFKPANVMIKNNVLKIGDFGFAKKANNPGSMKDHTIVGTPLYMPLQILKSQAYSSKCDVWALAFIFYEMLHGKTPWTGKSEYDLVQNLETIELKLDPLLSINTQDFLRKCLQPHQSKRACWDDIFMHPIFNGHFEAFALENLQFQDKLKTVMTQLRFQINANNIDLMKILSAFGYEKEDKQMDKGQFLQILRVVYPQISQKQSDYIFNRMDQYQKGRITLKQIQRVMSQHSISLTSVFRKIPNKLTTHKTESIQQQPNSPNYYMNSMNNMNNIYNIQQQQLQLQQQMYMQQMYIQQQLQGYTPGQYPNGVPASPQQKPSKNGSKKKS